MRTEQGHRTHKSGGGGAGGDRGRAQVLTRARAGLWLLRGDGWWGEGMAPTSLESEAQKESQELHANQGVSVG